MNILVSVSPLLFVVILCAGFRRPAFIVAWCGVALVAALVLASSLLQAEPSRHLQGLGAAALITLQAALVIGPGLYLNSLVSRSQAHDALVNWVERIPMAPLHKRLMIVVGLAPALESLTGFGVSLLVTVPLLLAASGRRIALRQSMLSMSIMPWGTLGLATVVGAQLSGQSVAALGFASSVVSFAVFPAFGMLTAWLSAEPPDYGRALRDGFLLGCVLSLGLVALNWLEVIELAGILAGLGSALFCLLLFCKSRHSIVPPWQAIRPYTIVLGLIGIVRLLPFIGVPTRAWAIEADGVHFAPLASPGLALLATILILGRGQEVEPLLHDALNRLMKPVLALGGFTLMAQMMVASGMIRIIGEALPASHPMQLGALSPLLGALSGYLTGSTVGGNALMMTMQASLTDDKVLQLTLSAIQNSSAGHAAFASMPIILLVLAIAGPGDSTEESDLVRFGLRVLLLVVMLVATAGLLLIAMG